MGGDDEGRKRGGEETRREGDDEGRRRRAEEATRGVDEEGRRRGGEEMEGLRCKGRREGGSRRPERLCGREWCSVRVYSLRVSAEGLRLRRGYCRGGEADGAVLQLGQPRAGVAAKGGL